MVQNHLMQLLSGRHGAAGFAQSGSGARREDQGAALLKPIGVENVAACTVRGQYRAGAVEGAAVGAYAEEAGTAPGAKPSNTETFVALKVEIENWRWSGVPFYSAPASGCRPRCRRSSSSSVRCPTRSSRRVRARSRPTC